jgi:hypothetical protein
MSKKVNAVLNKLDRRIAANEQSIVSAFLMAESMVDDKVKIRLLSKAKAMKYANAELTYMKDWINMKLTSSLKAEDI